MTTGSYASGSPPNYSSKSWSGGDGKYVLLDGRFVLKYNNYTMTRFRHSGTKSEKGYPMSIGVSKTRFMPANGIVKNQAKLVSAVRNHDFHLGKAVAEGRQTVNLVLNAVKTVATVIHKLQRADLPGAVAALGIDRHRFRAHDVSGRWLELQYGWLPLLSDVHESAKAFAAISDPPRTSRITVTTRLEDRVDTSASPSNYSGFGKRVNTHRIIYLIEESLSMSRSLGLVDPVGIAWELVPYSFVLDWFIPIGTYLDNLNIIPTLTGRFIVTDTCHIQSSGEVKNLFYYKGATASWDQLRITRTVTAGLTASRPAFKSLDEAMSPKHIWNAIALAHQKIK